MVDYRLLTFITLAKLKNYTKTAEQLNMTQPAVTGHIQYLEQYYQVPLIIREKRQIRLTAEGQILLEYAEKITSLSNGIQRTLHNQTNIIKKYKIGATLTIGEYILPKILGSYKELYPHIDIAMNVENTQTILKKIKNEEIDLGLVEGPFNKDKFNHKLFKKDRLILVTSSNSELAHQREISLDNLCHEKLILREEGSGTRLHFENAILKKGYTLKDFNLHMEIGNLNAIKSLVSSNLGLTVISVEVVSEELKKGTLHELTITGLNLEREFNFVYLNNRFNQNFIEDFSDFCLDVYNV